MEGFSCCFVSESKPFWCTTWLSFLEQTSEALNSYLWGHFHFPHEAKEAQKIRLIVYKVLFPSRIQGGYFCSIFKFISKTRRHHLLLHVKLKMGDWKDLCNYETEAWGNWWSEERLLCLLWWLFCTDSGEGHQASCTESLQGIKWDSQRTGRKRVAMQTVPSLLKWRINPEYIQDTRSERQA